MQIFVCGMHRSGTSVVARLLNMIGAYAGPEGSGLPANAENPKGFWERTDVVALNDRMLAEAGARWFDPYPWSMRTTVAPSGATLRAIRERLLDLDGHRPWFIKDPRLCLTLGAWLSQCERPVVVVCSRDATAVASSLAKHSLSLGFRLTRDEADALWEIYGRSLLQATEGLDCIHLRYEDVLASPMHAVEHLFAELRKAGVVGLRQPDRREVDAFVDPALQHHATSAQTPETHRAIAAALLGQGRAVPPLGETTQHVLAGLHRRLQRIDELGSSGLRDPRQIDAIQAHLQRRHVASTDRDFVWSAASLQRLLEPASPAQAPPSADAE